MSKQKKSSKAVPNKNSKTTENSKNKNSILGMLSANADGLGKKLHSLKHEISETNSKIFTIQETQFRSKGRVKIKDFVMFESIRKNKERGGAC